MSMEPMTAEQVADRLGVKVATVYAYVSRGHLRRRIDPGSRRSSYDAAEVEALARRGRPRRTTRPPALDFVIETSLTSIDDRDVTYRGRSVATLARTATFEEVAELLWTGTGDTATLPWRATPISIPDVGSPRDRLRLAVVLAAAADPPPHAPDIAATLRRARSLLATMAEALPAGPSTVGAAAGPSAGGSPRSVPPGQAPGSPTIAERLWHGLTAEPATGPSLAALNGALVLLADHELAVSTLAARVAASAGADPYAVVLAGMGPVAGPLHGGAPVQAYELIRSAVTGGVDAAVSRHEDPAGHLPGFGHRVYGGADPRAIVLGELVRDAWRGHPTLDVADRIATVARRRTRAEPNIDFALATFAAVAGMRAEAGEVVFTIARTAGWIAHAIEEYGEPPLRFRARAVPRRSPTDPGVPDV